MKERNLIPNDTKIRERKSCPSCSSLNVAKYRKHRGFYRCRACHALFPNPGIKKVKTSAGIPTTLKEIIEKKERQTATDVKETIL
jgi:ribosomal protein L37AE/L43A